mmetsp:Transcript_39028/g.107493  ORF Transcript_39028/g.107493 Transcript_39028/m.107493 type:complete len:216 (-) Transcript_39028:1443-2090(-)
MEFLQWPAHDGKSLAQAFLSGGARPLQCCNRAEVLLAHEDVLEPVLYVVAELFRQGFVEQLLRKLVGLHQRHQDRRQVSVEVEEALCERGRRDLTTALLRGIYLEVVPETGMKPQQAGGVVREKPETEATPEILRLLEALDCELPSPLRDDKDLRDARSTVVPDFLAGRPQLNLALETREPFLERENALQLLEVLDVLGPVFLAVTAGGPRNSRS